MSAQPVIRDGCMIGIQSQDIDLMWSHIEPLIKKPLERMGDIERYTTDVIRERLNNCELQCWAAIGPNNEILCVFITRITEYPTGYKDLTIWLVGGKGLKYWITEAWSLFVEFGKYHKCGRIVTCGRPGWNKLIGKMADIEETTGFTAEL